MAAGAWQVYGLGIEAMLENVIGALNDTGTPRYRMVLVTSAYTPSDNVHATWTDVSANEVAAAGGYSTHGKLLTSTVVHAAGTATYDCDDQSWTSSTITAKYAVIVEDADANAALASTDRLVAYSDLDTGGGSVSTTSGTFAVNINASGVFTVAQV
ncbi:MAG TPA: hypothetical protein VMX97_10315 [Hyphomicrobiaceae bacterium]|nr:hypothetical protein [Hyphomicrobiaceae bacterium]